MKTFGYLVLFLVVVCAGVFAANRINTTPAAPESFTEQQRQEAITKLMLEQVVPGTLLIGKNGYVTAVIARAGDGITRTNAITGSGGPEKITNVAEETFYPVIKERAIGTNLYANVAHCFFIHKPVRLTTVDNIPSFDLCE